jgi:hypothetical protein
MIPCRGRRCFSTPGQGNGQCDEEVKVARFAPLPSIQRIDPDYYHFFAGGLPAITG